MSRTVVVVLTGLVFLSQPVFKSKTVHGQLSTYQIKLNNTGFEGNLLQIFGTVTINTDNDVIQDSELYFQLNGESAWPMDLIFNDADDDIGGDEIDFVDVGSSLYFTIASQGFAYVTWEADFGGTGETATLDLFSSATEDGGIVVTWSDGQGGFDSWANENPGPNGFFVGNRTCLFGDDFNDNAIDGMSWNTLTDSGTVMETNNRIEIQNWGFLTTVDQFDPQELGVVVVSGTWWSPNSWNVSASDRLKVTTRCDGTAIESNGVFRNGIRCSTNWDFGNPRLTITEGVNGVHTLLTETTANFGPGDVLDFLIVDDGDNISFTIKPRVVGRNATTLTASSSLSFAQNRVAFHTRGNHNGLATLSYFDNLAVSNGSVLDSFNDNHLDDLKWSTLTDVGSVIETNERLEIQNWGFLTTNDQFNPAELGAVAVSGTWWSPNNWNASASDRMKVTTRCDGSAIFSNGVFRNGIRCSTNWDFGNPRLTITEGIDGIHTLLTETTGDFGPGDVLDFLIVDNGNQISFTVKPRGDGRSATTITANPTLTFVQNRVAFHTRGNHNGLATLSYFDNLAVSSRSCQPQLADVNVDGFVNLLDVQPFVELLNSGEYQLEADMNEDGSVDLLDVQPFVHALAN